MFIATDKFLEIVTFHHRSSVLGKEFVGEFDFCIVDTLVVYLRQLVELASEVVKVFLTVLIIETAHSRQMQIHRMEG